MKTLTNADCMKVLEKCTKTHQEILHINLHKLSEDTTGFLGEHLCLEIRTKGTGHVHKFFVKLLPTSQPAFENYVHEIGVFKKELDLYATLLGKLQKFTAIPWSPKCYLIKDNALVMEDLYESGFQLEDYRSYLSEAHFTAFIVTIARFHATSIVCEEEARRNTGRRDFTILDNYAHLVRESAFIADASRVRNQWLKCNGAAVRAILELLPGYLPEYGDKWERMLTRMHELVRPSTKYRNVVNHGDLWCNNMMFRVQRGRLECILVDFQFARYTSAAYDLMVAFHTTTEVEFRRKHMHALLDVYYETLRAEVETYGMRMADVFPRQEFRDACRYYRSLGLIDAALNSMLIFYEQGIVAPILSEPDKFLQFTLIDKNELVIQNFHDDEVFRQRITNICDDLMKTVLSQDLSQYLN